MSGSQNGHPGWFSAGRGASLKTLWCVIGSIWLASSVSYSIVIRHDVADARYRIRTADFPALALLPLRWRIAAPFRARAGLAHQPDMPPTPRGGISNENQKPC